MTHLEWGPATTAQCAVRLGPAGDRIEHHFDNLHRQPYVLVLSNSTGGGLALQGSRADLLEFLHRAHEHVAQNTSRLAELGAALHRLHELRADAADRYGDTGYGLAEIRRLDEDEVDVLNDDLTRDLTEVPRKDTP